jgi:uncharacterized protein (DUF924 family)
MKTPGDVLAFWFGDPPKTIDDLKKKLRKWFGGGPEVDGEIKRDFGDAVDAAIDGKLDAWLAEPTGWLAQLVVLDQFTRNCFRGDARTHAGDARAEKLTLEALEKGSLHAQPMQERHFALMPLLHAEDADCQARYRAEFPKFLADVPEEFRPFFGAGTEQGEKYGEIIRRFGRFPHRNAILGRTSTPEEIAFLADWEKKRAPQIARDLGIDKK